MGLNSLAFMAEPALESSRSLASAAGLLLGLTLSRIAHLLCQQHTPREVVPHFQIQQSLASSRRSIERQLHHDY